MPIPHLTYSVSDLPGLVGAAAQAASSADRPLCALIAALSSYLRGFPIRGQGLGLSDDALQAKFAAGFLENDVPLARAERWAQGCAGERMQLTLDIPSIAGMDIDQYQITAARHVTVAGGGFALDMGLGKTLTSVFTALQAKGGGYALGTRCWIVCPLNAMGAWAPFVSTLELAFKEVRIYSVDSLHKYVAAPPIGGVLIIDEGHQLGAMEANRTKRAHKLRRLFDFCVVNTGTLLHAGVEKVLSLMDLCVPGGAAFATRWKCGEHFHCLVQKQVGSRTHAALEKPSAGNLGSFADYVGHLFTVLDTDSPTVRECISIPPQDTETVSLGLPWLPLDDLVVQTVEGYLARGEALPSMPEVAHLLSRTGIGPKLEWLSHCIDDTPLVIFAHYTETMDALEAFCKEKNLTYRRIDGTTPQKDRPGIEADFTAGKFQVLLGQMRAAGVSLNLQRAWISIAFDFSWSAIDYAQAKRRTRRRGQTRECTHYDLVSNRLQNSILARLVAGASFNKTVAAYQDLRRGYAAARSGSGLPGMDGGVDGQDD